MTEKLNESYYFMGEISESQYFSNLIDHVGIMHDSRDLHLILSDLPKEPKMFYIHEILQAGLVKPLLEEMKELTVKLGKKKTSNPSIEDYPASQTFIKILADPITVYESTLLPLKFKDITSVLLTEPIFEEIKGQYGGSEAAEDLKLLYDKIGNKSFFEVMLENDAALAYALDNTDVEKQTVVGQIFLSLLREIIVVYRKAESDFEKAKSGLYQLVKTYTNRMHAVMTEKKMITTPFSSSGYMVLISGLRRHHGDTIKYDGSNLESATEIIKNFRDTGTEIAVTPHDVVDRHAGIIMVAAETAGGKTSLAEAMGIWTRNEADKPATFDRVHLSEPNRPALLGTEGTNEAIEYALHSSADVITIDSMSHIPVEFAKGQPLTSKGVSWNIREIFMSLGILCMAHGKTIVVILNVESGQKGVYGDLFRGIAYVTYSKEGIGQTFWDITLREADSRKRKELRTSDKDVFSTLDREREYMSVNKTKRRVSKRFLTTKNDPYFRDFSIEDF